MTTRQIKRRLTNDIEVFMAKKMELLKKIDESDPNHYVKYEFRQICALEGRMKMAKEVLNYLE